jgi:uncharacterized protein YqjF (DUF2071 family)
VEGHDFDFSILEETRHRPWPMPDSPWVMTQTWHDLLFAHWRVDKKHLASKLPGGLELDVYEGEAWLGVVPFRMTNVAPRAVPALPWVSAFPELNVRTYVRVHDRPGVYFFSLDAGNPLAVAAARALFNLPYYLAAMDVHAEQDTIHYHSVRKADAAVPAEFAGSYRPVGSAFTAAAGSLDYFLTERYCLYTADGSSPPRRLDIHHPPWSLHLAEATVQKNTMPQANGLSVHQTAPLLHFARRQDVVAWLPKEAH